jgi:hypothetical protein
MNNETNDLKYRVEAVELAEAPADMPQDVWHSYLIVRGKSRIEGLKPGSHFDVTQHAEAVAEGLNERLGRASTAYVSSKKKK